MSGLFRPNICHGCLQYAEDCECCAECGLAEVHDPECSFAPTRPRRAEVPTLRGLGRPSRPRHDTEKIPVYVFRVGPEQEASGLATTEQYAWA